jgi:phosphosulfolactate synthase
LNKTKLNNKSSSWEYLRQIGVGQIPPRSSPLDPGYDPLTLESHLQQSGHLIEVLKLSMACWQIADEDSTRYKIQAAKRLGIKVTTGGGPFEIAASFNKTSEFLNLCADLGVNRVEVGEGFANNHFDPVSIVRECHDLGLEVQFELGEKHKGAFTPQIIGELIEQGKNWLDAGAVQLIIEARENANNIGLFDIDGVFDVAGTERFVNAFGFDSVSFEAPNKASQFAFLKYFGSQIHLCNIRLEELLRVEIYRRGLHSDAFEHEKLRPTGQTVN